MINLGKSLSSKPLNGLIQSIFDPMPQKVLFRTDAGRVKGLSFGHAARCVVLAEALQKRNVDIRFLMRSYAEGVAYVRERGVDVVTFPSECSIAKESCNTVAEVEAYNPDWLVVDLPYPDLDTTYFSTQRSRGIHICFIDDARFITPDADVILNSSILALDQYVQTAKEKIRFLLGPDYFIFNPGKVPFASPFPRKSVCKVVISFGGSDPARMTEKIVAQLVKNNPMEISFYVILGPGYSQKAALLNLIRPSNMDITLIDAPVDIYPYFTNADLLICAGGRTLYEAAVLNVPVFPIASINHEKPVIEVFVKKKIALAGMVRWNGERFMTKLVSWAVQSNNEN